MGNRFASFFNRLLPVKYTCLNIEITDYCIKMAEISILNNKRPHIRNYAIEPLPARSMDDGHLLDPIAVMQTLQSMLTYMNVGTKRVHFSLPSQLIMLRFLQLPDLKEKDLRKIIDFELKHNIHLPFSDPYYDFVKLNGSPKRYEEQKNDAFHDNLKRDPDEELLQEVAYTLEENLTPLGDVFPMENEKSGSDISINKAEQDPAFQCEVMLVAASRRRIEEFVDIFQSLHLKPVVIEMKALAMFRLIEYCQTIDPGSTFLLVDINKNLSDVSIFANGQLKISRTIPISFLENDSFVNASNELAVELERLINFYRYTLNHREQEFDHILLSGDISYLDEVADRLAERISVQIRRFLPHQLKSDLPDFEHIFASMAVPIGLGIRGKQR